MSRTCLSKHGKKTLFRFLLSVLLDSFQGVPGSQVRVSPDCLFTGRAGFFEVGEEELLLSGGRYLVGIGSTVGSRAIPGGLTLAPRSSEDVLVLAGTSSRVGRK